jgi:translocation and assembly module TamB
VGALVLDGEYRLTLPRLSALSSIAGTPLAGKLTVNGEIGGSLTAPKLTARLRSPALSVDEVLVGSLEARVNVAQHSRELSGHADLVIDHPRAGKVRVASQFSSVADQTLQFRELIVESRDAKLTGAMAVNLSNATVTGKMAGQALSLAPWSDLARRTLSGRVDVAVHMDASGVAQQMDLTLEVDGLKVTLGPEQVLNVGTLAASARVEDLFGSPTGGLRLAATDSRVSDLQIDDLIFELKADGPRRASGSLRVRGDPDGPFDLQVLGDYQALHTGFVVSISKLDASLSGQSVKLTRPTRFEHDGETAALSETTLSVAGGALTVSGEIGTERIGAQLALERIALSDLAAVMPMADLTGTLSGHARLSGTRKAPVGKMELRLADLRSAHTTLAAAPPASGRLRGDWRDGRLQLTASVTEVADSSIEARGSLPLQLDPVTLALSMPPDGAIEGDVNWSGELGPVWDLLSAYEDRFTGPGDLALTLAGTAGSPRVNGHFRVAGGRYENVLTGTTLSDVQLRLVGDGDKLVLQELTAGDDKNGTLEGSGTIEFIPARSYPTNLHLAFSDMLLVARDDLTLNASGNLLFAGTLSDALLRGEIVTGPSELSLAGALPSQVVELDVEEINVESAAHATIRAPASAADSFVVILDLDVSVPGRAFVRGLGLDSEWMGNVKISGNSSAPNVAGVLNPVRGRFSLMGKSFRLERGAIRFTGTDDVDPLLDLTAEHKTKNLTALVRVTGSASKPEISLTSRPPLPESEIASQVLFGTDSSKLSPAQSLQLASAIATYSGTGGAVGVLDATRRALGVDVIDFTESEEDPDTTRVSIGKYVTEGVYIEVERGAEQSSRTSTTVEVEVLPDVRIEGGTTETGGNKVGLKWQWDY